MSWFRFALQMLTGGLIVGSATLAQAQTDSLTIHPNVIVDRSYDRPADTEPLHLSRRDCDENAPVTFPVTINSTRVRALEVWVGRTACDSQQRRSEDDCRLVTSGEFGSGNRNFILDTQQIVGQDCVGLQRANPPVTVTLFFAFIGDDGAPNPSESAVEPITYDVFAPDPPDLTGLGQGDGQLIPRWGALDGSDVTGYRFYCDGGNEAMPGVAGAAGASANAECSSSLVTGEVPSEAFYCGQQENQSSGRGTIRGRENDQLYAVGVVATDTVGNVGTLSNVLCERPKEVTDFFEAYTEAGGQGGGGFCSLSFSQKAYNPIFAVMLLSAAAALTRKRRRPHS